MSEAESYIGPTSEDLDAEIVAEMRRRVAHNQRARLLVDTVLTQGFMSTVDLSNAGYEHPPRAARDVRELGIPLISPRASVDGRSVAHYRFPDQVILDRDAAGRRVLPARLKQELIDLHGPRDTFSGSKLPVSMLEVDHRIPFGILPDSYDSLDPQDFMLVSGSMNRTKSWECEHCPNWTGRDRSVCETCYWANPDREYDHIATFNMRRIDLAWTGAAEVDAFEGILSRARAQDMTVSEFVKRELGRSAGE